MLAVASLPDNPSVKRSGSDQSQSSCSGYSYSYQSRVDPPITDDPWTTTSNTRQTLVNTAMADDQDSRSGSSNGGPIRPGGPQRSDSFVSTTPSDGNETTIHQPVPTRPRLPSRKSSGPLVVPRDSSAVGPVEPHFGPDDVRAMSPRRTSEDIDKMGKEAREEMRKHAKALQDSLLTIFNRIEAVREEHDKLDSNNKFLQKYIGDLMSTSKITASGSRGKK